MPEISKKNSDIFSSENKSFNFFNKKELFYINIFKYNKNNNFKLIIFINLKIDFKRVQIIKLVYNCNFIIN